jgi:hypothetical protein
MTPVSEIKLIRTDTTLDLSQKAEKVWNPNRTESVKKIQKKDCEIVGGYYFELFRVNFWVMLDSTISTVMHRFSSEHRS